MASTLTAANLVTVISESINLNGRSHGSSSTKTITGITNITKSIITCLTAAEVAILGVNAATSTDMGKSYLAGQYDQDDVRYIRITNLDDEHYVWLTFRNNANTSANEIGLKLDRGCSFIYPLDLDGGTENTMTSSTSALSLASGSGTNDLIDIVGVANTADVELEVFVATV